MAKPATWLPWAVYVGGGVPLALLGSEWVQGELGANPVDRVLNQLGLLGLIALFASLSCTPIQLLTKWTWPARVRKALGLLGFTFITLHFLTWAVVDQGLAVARLTDDVIKHPFITVGFAAWLLLIPLAITSTAASVRRLGFPRWKRLHRLVYVIAILGVVHFTWKQKKSIVEPVVYGVVLSGLLAIRVGDAVRRGKKA